MLYERDVIACRWFQPGQERVLLVNEQLAHRSGLKVGDGITIANATRAERWTVIGELHDQTGGLGLAGIALAPISQLRPSRTGRRASRTDSWSGLRTSPSRR